MGKALVNTYISFALNNLGKVTVIDSDLNNCLKITALENLTISFPQDLEYNNHINITWKHYIANSVLEVEEGQSISFKGNLIPNITNGIGTFIISGSFDISGNPLYLLEDNLLCDYAFKYLFKDCEGLVNANELILPDNIAISCYEGMFKNCSSLETAPILTSSSLANNCYKELFYNCELLNYIEINSLTKLSSLYSLNWVYNVSEEGTFKQKISVENDFGVNGIPENWEVIYGYSSQYFTIESLEDNNTITAVKNSSGKSPIIYYSFDNGETWSNLTLSSGTITFGTINTGEKIIFKSTISNWATDWNKYNKFNGSKNFKVYGNIMSLLNGDNFISNSEFNNESSFNLAGLFYGTTTIVDARDLVFPTLTLTVSCYNGMFRGCTNLINSPKLLPALTIPKDAYSSMFEGCVSLIEGPEISATNVSGDSAFMRMFCMNRNSKVTSAMTKSPILRVTNPSEHSNVYQQLFAGNGNIIEITILAEGTNLSFSNWLANTNTSGVIKKLSTTTLTTGGNGIPSGWTTENYTETE